MTASKLVLTTPGTGWASGSSCLVPFVVSITDAGGTPDATWRGTVTASVSGGGSATLSGPTTYYHEFASDTGACTFRRLALIGAGQVNTITFTASPDATFPNLTSVTSGSITVGAQTGTFMGGVVELPRAVPVAPEFTADVTTVVTSATLQAALNADGALNAAGGGTLNRDYVFADGTTPTGNFIWPLRPADATGYQRVRCQSALPTARGTRATPATMGGRATLSTGISSAVFIHADAAGGLVSHHCILAGLTIAAAPSTNPFVLVAFGTAGALQSASNQVPHDFYIDRCVLNGGATNDISHAVLAYCGTGGITDCSLLEFHSLSSDGGHAVTLGNGQGPFAVLNSTLECSGVIVLLGGTDPTITELVPSDITVRGCLVTRKTIWNRNNFASYPASTGWLVKNNLDIKNAQRVEVDGNVFENCWVDGQGGSLTNIKSVNQGGTAPWCGGSHITLRRNLYRNAVSSLGLAGSPEAKQAVHLSCVWIQDSVAINAGRLVSLDGGDTYDVTLDHVTYSAGNTAPNVNSLYAGGTGTVHYRFRYTNSLATAGSEGPLAGQVTFPPAVFSTFLPGCTFTKNAFGNPTAGWSATNANFPAGNFLDGVTTTSMGFVNALGIEATWDVAAVDDICAALTLTSGSPYHLFGTDSKDLGADMTALRAALAGTTPAVTADHLVVLTQPNDTATGSPHATQPVVRVADVSGNTVATDASLVTAELVTLSGIGGPMGVLAVTALGGFATFSGLGVVGFGTFQWLFQDGSLTPTLSRVFTVGQPDFGVTPGVQRPYRLRGQRPNRWS